MPGLRGANSSGHHLGGGGAGNSPDLSGKPSQSCLHLGHLGHRARGQLWQPVSLSVIWFPVRESREREERSENQGCGCLDVEGVSASQREKLERVGGHLPHSSPARQEGPALNTDQGDGSGIRLGAPGALLESILQTPCPHVRPPVFQEGMKGAPRT